MSIRLPNILLVIMDCARADHFGAYGWGRDTTPTVDRLAEDGIVFENVFSSGIWTLESVASLYTGLYSSQHGVDIDHPRLGSEPIHLASYLQSRGYQTAAFAPTGSWHSRTFSFDRGFEHFQEAYRAFTWLERLAPTETLTEKVWRHVKYRLGWAYDKGGRSMNQAVQEWFRSLHEESPFFVVAHYLEPHLPYIAPDPHYSKFLPAGLSRSRTRTVNQDAFRYLAHEVEMEEEDFVILGALYDGCLHYMDALLEELISHLEYRGVLDETWMILIADHGENLGDHGLMDHQYCLYDTLVHVPLVIRPPGGLRGGSRVGKLAQNVDILPTVIGLLDDSIIGLPGEVRGRNLLSSGSGHEFAISEYLSPVFKRFEFAHAGFDCREYDRQLRAIRTREHKLIWSSDGTHELYHLDTDPAEHLNVIDTSPDVASRLMQQLSDWEQSVSGPHWEPQSVDIDPVMEERLRGLGYL